MITWHKCAQEMPVKSGWYLVRKEYADQSYFVAWFHGEVPDNHFWTLSEEGDYIVWDITHWAEITEPIE